MNRQHKQNLVLIIQIIIAIIKITCKSNNANERRGESELCTPHRALKSGISNPERRFGSSVSSSIQHRQSEEHRDTWIKEEWQGEYCGTALLTSCAIWSERHVFYLKKNIKILGKQEVFWEGLWIINHLKDSASQLSQASKNKKIRNYKLNETSRNIQEI